MLTLLYLQNYTLINTISLDFNTGFTAITGETGAGKSILVGALKLLSGEKPEAKHCNDPTKKLVIEATFNLNDTFLNSLTQDLDIDYENTLIIRRELAPDGKNRAFINDTPVTVAILKNTMKQLIDIHSQNESLELKDNAYRFEIIDHLAQNNNRMQILNADYKSLKALKNALNAQESALNDTLLQKDFMQYQFDELVEAALINENEVESIEEELKKLKDIDKLNIIFNKCNDVVVNADFGLSNGIAMLKQIIKPISNSFQITLDKINAVDQQIIDLMDHFNAQLHQLVEDPERIIELENRLNKLNNLLYKHKVNSLNELILKTETIAEKLASIEENQALVVATTLEIQAIEKKINENAVVIHQKREEIKTAVEQQMNTLLQELGFNGATFKIVIEKKDQISAVYEGLTKMSWLFSASTGQPLMPIEKVASGGELSRLLLALKQLSSFSNFRSTLVFDEIDTGISGETAKKVGNVIKKLAENQQIIAITHLPQIAAKANYHLLAEKQNTESIAKSNLLYLNFDQQINRIAEMLSGSNPSPAAIKNAKELINH